MTDLQRFPFHGGPAGADAAGGSSRHFGYLDVRVPDAFWSCAIVFGLSACAVAASAAGQRFGVIGYVALTGLLVAFFPHFALRANLRSLWLWAYPAWACLSAGWSINPDRTFHSTLLLVPTIIAALAVGAMPARREANAGAALAMFVYIAYSFAANGHSVIVDTAGEQTAFVGFITSKNYFGHIAALSVILSLALFGIRGRWRLLAAGLGVVDLAMSGLALVASHATGSLIAALIGIAIGAAVLVFRHVGWQVRILMTVALVSIVAVYATFGQEVQDQLFAAVLKTFNKDPGLTGRRYLWDFTDRLIGQHFILGYGYNSFWFYTNPDAWTIWRMMGIPPMGGFNFHNLYRETLIDCGAVGLALLLGSFCFSAVRVAVAGLRDGDLAVAVRIAYITYFVVRTGVETTGFAALTIDTTLLFGFVCLPVLPARTSVPGRPAAREDGRFGRVRPSRRPAMSFRHS